MFAAVHYRMRLDRAGVDLYDALYTVDQKADGVRVILDDDDARFGAGRRCRRVTHPAARIDEHHDRAAKRENSDDRRIGVGNARNRPRRNDLDDPIDVDRILLSGDRKREELELQRSLRRSCAFDFGTGGTGRGEVLGDPFAPALPVLGPRSSVLGLLRLLLEIK